MSCYTCNSNENFKKCSTCKVIKYCSTNCQKNDWHRHKLECFNNDICPICLTQLSRTNFCQTKCGHRFHLDCFLLSYHASKLCPYCRTNIP